MNNDIQVDKAVSKSRKKTLIIAVAIIVIVVAGLISVFAKQTALNNKKVEFVNEWLVEKILTDSDVKYYVRGSGLFRDKMRAEYRSSYHFNADNSVTVEYYVKDGTVDNYNIDKYVGKEGKDWFESTTLAHGTWDIAATFSGDIILTIKNLEDETGKAIGLTPMTLLVDSAWNVTIKDDDEESSWEITE